MALGKYTRIDNRRQSSTYCSAVTIVVLVALGLVAVWMLTSTSSVPGQNLDLLEQGKKNDLNRQVIDSSEVNNKHFEYNPGDVPNDAKKGDASENASQGKSSSDNQDNSEEKTDVKKESKAIESSNDETNTEIQSSENSTQDRDSKTVDGEINSDGPETKANEGESNAAGQGNLEENSTENKSDLGEMGLPDSIETEKRQDSDKTEKKFENSGEAQEKVRDDGLIDEKIDQGLNKESEDGNGGQDTNQSFVDVFPSGGQSDILNETAAQIGSWKTQASESKNEKELSSKQKVDYDWKLCNVTAGPDYIPCLDNLKAIKSLRSTKHYEHRERHCPEDPPTCLVPLPDGYQPPIRWPKSRDKIWYHNIPHTKLAEIKGHQNWVKVTGEFLTFPGGGTQFKKGALHYIDFISESMPDIAWGKHIRVILDVGCGVASFGGYLFDRDVLTMSFAPKDEHEAQVQFALERGIPAISAVMGTKRLPFPSIVFDAVHCARCRVPWHIEGGKLLLELNRVLRPGGFFVWSATPAYRKTAEDVGIWKAMTELTKAMCWKLVSKTKDTINGVGVAIYKKPTSNNCYKQRSQQEPPICEASDDANAAWNVSLQSCMHQVPDNSGERGSQWPEQWPSRLDKAPFWMLNSQIGVYGKPAQDDFTVDYEHWKQVVSKSYLNGMGINWATVRNVMDMNAIYGGFAAAVRDMNVWVMNVVSINSADTLPIIYERGLLGVYHDWCESFNTYPRSYDLLHADHLFSKVKKRCNFVSVVAEVDRILRPEGKLIVRDNVETINELEDMAKSMQWDVRKNYAEGEGLLCVRKSMWRPKEFETITYAIA